MSQTSSSGPGCDAGTTLPAQPALPSRFSELCAAQSVSYFSSMMLFFSMGIPTVAPTHQNQMKTARKMMKSLSTCGAPLQQITGGRRTIFTDKEDAWIIREVAV